MYSRYDIVQNENYCVYRHTCLEDPFKNMSYIGTTCNIKNRWKASSYISNQPNSKFSLAIKYIANKYDITVATAFEKYFKHEILFESCDPKKIGTMECYYIGLYNAIDAGFNKEVGGELFVLDIMSKMNSTTKNKTTIVETNSTKNNPNIKNKTNKPNLLIKLKNKFIDMVSGAEKINIGYNGLKLKTKQEIKNYYTNTVIPLASGKTKIVTEKKKIIFHLYVVENSKCMNLDSLTKFKNCMNNKYNKKYQLKFIYHS